MSAAPQYQDDLIRTYNQRLWYGFLATGGLLALAISLAILLALRPPPLPYVIAVDPGGKPVGVLSPMPGTTEIADTVISYVITQWIELAFRMDTTPDLETSWLLPSAYAMLPKDSQAYNSLTEFYQAKENNPLLLGHADWQDVQNVTVLKLPPNRTYQASFQLIRHTNNGQGKVITNWTATIQIQQGQPTRENLLGFYVTSLYLAPERKEG